MIEYQERLEAEWNAVKECGSGDIKECKLLRCGIVRCASEIHGVK